MFHCANIWSKWLEKHFSTNLMERKYDRLNLLRYNGEMQYHCRFQPGYYLEITSLVLPWHYSGVWVGNIKSKRLQKEILIWWIWSHALKVLFVYFLANIPKKITTYCEIWTITDLMETFCFSLIALIPVIVILVILRLTEKWITKSKVIL